MSKHRPTKYSSNTRLIVLGLMGLLGLGTLSLWLRSAPVKAQEAIQLSPTIVVFSENFDGVVAPSLPAGWITSHSGVIDSFTTVTTFPDSAPNAVFINDPNTEGTAELITPPIALGNIQHKLSFRHFYQLDFEFDGGVLELSINGGTFQDIVSAGGTILSGGYDTTLVSSSLSGRRAWTGQQAAYVTTEVNLPASTMNQSVRFKWRMATDDMEAGTGWRIDNVQVTNNISGTNATAISIPSSGAASPYPSEIAISNLTGFVTDVQVGLTNFSHTSPDDVDLMLVAPNGSKVVLMSDVGGSNPVSNLNLTFSDSAAASLPDNLQITSGSYKPTNFEPGDNFPAPGGTPTGGRLSVLNGSIANGTWQLCLVDDNGNNAGSISGGWNISILSSPDAIVIPDNGTALPYSSDKLILGIQGTITKATVTLSNFSHTSPDDVDVLLVAPNGKRIVLMSDAGGNTEAGGLNLVFDDNATLDLPDSALLTSGTYKPTDFEPGDVFPSPAPQGPTSATTLNAFYGSSPTGLWKLFVVDDNGGNPGSIAGSWSLSLQTSTTACSFSLSPLVQAFPITGGSGSFGITMPAICSWAASTNSGFLTINSSLSGTGNATINYSVAPNLSGGRAGTIDVSNGVVTITFQVQQPSGCPFAVNQSTLNFGTAGGIGNVGVTAGGVCGWQATSTVNWIQVTSTPQTGDGTATISVQSNTTGNPRSATITVGARSFAVNQAGASARLFDFDGDGKADISVFRQSNGFWFLDRSTAGFTQLQFGISTDKLAPGDFDGDGKADVSIYRDGFWYRLNSTNGTFVAVQFGAVGDAVVPADYDGDGKTDIAVFRQGSWYFLNSSTGQVGGVQFGFSTDKPVPADFDGDGRADVAVYRDGIWYWLQSSNGQLGGLQFGVASDKAVVGDYDGDGRADQAVYRGGVWYMNRSTAGFTGVQFGLASDIPTPADYDGDGKTDISVFRDGNWYRINSTNGQFVASQFGLASDKPIPGTYVP